MPEQFRVLANLFQFLT